MFFKFDDLFKTEQNKNSTICLVANKRCSSSKDSIVMIKMSYTIQFAQNRSLVENGTHILLNTGS